MSIRQHSLLNILALARSNSQILPSLKMQSDSVFLRNLLPPLLRALLLASCLFTAPAIALSLFGGNTSSDELLPPEQAFRAAVTTASDGGQLQVTIDIADGYYLYRDKLGLSSDSARFGELQLPAGIQKDDEFFGQTETYRGPLAFSADIIDAGSTTELPVTVQSQGCADIGVCYPPHTETFTIALPARAIAAVTSALPPPSVLPATNFTNQPTTDNSAGLFAPVQNSGIGQLFGNDESDILDPEVAFTVFAGSSAPGTVSVTWNIEDAHYLYRDKFNFEILSPAGVSADPVNVSRGEIKQDEFFGEVEVLRGQATADLTLQNLSGNTDLTLRATYQGCADIGICYPPQSKELTLPVMAATAMVGANGTTATATPSTLAAPSNTTPVANSAQGTNPRTTLVSEQDRLANSLKSGSRLTTILTFFGMGLLLTFTPCVLPMIPILSSIIVGQGDKIGTGRAFTLSLVYVLAMALTYTIAGVIVGLTGDNIQAVFQHPYVITAFVALFVFLAASMFGLFELQMPAFVQDRLMRISNNQKSGSFAGVATMGLLSALIVGPCVTAPLVGALIYIGQTGDAVLGGAALFALSMGMGVPLLLIGTSFGKFVPTAGAWMDTVKALFGVMLLGVAIWMLDRIVPGAVTMALSALLAILVGVFMGAFDSTDSNTPAIRKLAKGAAFAAVVYGTLLLIGVSTGSGTLLRPLQGLALGNQNGNAAGQHLSFQRVTGMQPLQAALADAKANNKTVMLDFYADWCVSCKEMEAFTFVDDGVISRLSNTVLLQADVTANNADDKALLKHFGMFGPPAIIFYDANGNELTHARVVGFVPPAKFAQHLDAIL